MRQPLLYRLRRMSRWPVLLGALAIGIFLTAAVDIVVRSFCSPTGSIFEFPFLGRGGQQWIVEWSGTPLAGLAMHGWGWSDLDLLSGRYSPDSTVWGASTKRIDRADAAARYGLLALMDTKPINAPYGGGELSRLRATRFGFPFYSSIREHVEFVKRGDAQVASTLGRVKVSEGWVWSAGPPRTKEDILYMGRWAKRYWLLPFGALLNVLFFGSLAWLVVTVPLVLRDLRRARRGLCIACAYPLSGLPSPVCPECGLARPITATFPTLAHDRRGDA
jgi:hypothetical protein